MSKRSKEDDIFQIRITDKAAVYGLAQLINVLIAIRAVLLHKKLPKTYDLVEEMQIQIKKSLKWLDRIPDGTLYSFISKKEVDLIKKQAKEVLKWQIIPSDTEYEKMRKLGEEWDNLQLEKKDAYTQKLLVMLDTSFLLALAFDKEEKHKSVKMVADYLKNQNRYFDLRISNLVLLELLSKLKQHYSFKVASSEFESLLRRINESHILIKDEKLNMYEVFSRYKEFSRKSLSSQLKSNDFFIATEAIKEGAIFVTCDIKMFTTVKKTYKNIFLISDQSASYVKFIQEFEKLKDHN